jgi:hypothetical protein
MQIFGKNSIVFGQKFLHRNSALKGKLGARQDQGETGPASSAIAGVQTAPMAFNDLPRN